MTLAIGFLTTLAGADGCAADDDFGLADADGVAFEVGIVDSVEAEGEGPAWLANAAGVSSSPAGETANQTPPAPWP